MKKFFVLLLLSNFFLPSVGAKASVQESDQLLKCSFGIMGAPIFLTETELNDDGSVGARTKASFQGSPVKIVNNRVFAAPAPLLYFFQLDEGFDNNNIAITVSSKRNAQNEYLAVAENPQTPQFRKMSGSCGVQ